MSNPVATALRNNPYFLLGVGVDATPMDIERAAQRWLALLEIGAASARTVQTPLGPTERSADLVRQALAALRVEEQRRLYAILMEAAPPAETAAADPLQQWSEAPRSIGWCAPWPR